MGEDEKERLNRKLIELLQELRVALPGIQVLFAFLLALPFTERFPEISEVQRDVYFASFLCAAVASALLIAPSAYHRLRWRVLEKEDLDEKRRMLAVSGRLASAGIVFLALAIIGVVYLIADLLFAGLLAVALTALLAAVFAWFWYLLPMVHRIRWDADRGRDGPGPGPRSVAPNRRPPRAAARSGS